MSRRSGALSWFREVIAIFIIAFMLRLMPELWSPFPVGYDVPLYVTMSTHFWQEPVSVVAAEPPLAYFLLWLVHLTGVDLYAAIKVIAPILYGFLVSSFYFFLRINMGWDVEKSRLCAILCAVQPAALRISWDLLKNELGLAALLLFLVVFRKWGQKRPLTAILALLVALSHELPTILMFLFVAYEALRERRQLGHIIGLALPMVPAGLVFFYRFLVFTGMFRGQFCTSFRDIIWLRSVEDGLRPFFRTMFPRNYFLERPFRSASWADVVLYVPTMFVMCFITLLPIALLGVRRHGPLDVLSAWMAFASFSVIACPWAYPFAHFFRWMLMMVFPLSIYATDGVLKLAEVTGRRAVLGVFLAVNAALGVAYANGFSHIRFFPPMTAYMPDRMTYSTMELHQIDDCLACLAWLNEHAEPSSVLVVEQRFFAWALQWLDERIIIAAYRADIPLEDVELGPVLENYEHVYIMWFVGQEPSWRGHGTVELFSSGDIAVYMFVGG